MRHILRRLVVSGAALVPAFAIALPTGSALATTTLPNGFTAAVIAASGQTISGEVDADGYDVGIYVGPGVHDVAIRDATVSGANDQGILVQDASYVLIKDSTVEGNAVNPAAGLNEVKGIVLAGSSHVSVLNNDIVDNEAGGIAVLDDGHNSPFAPTAINTSPVHASDNLISRNNVQDNVESCAVVVAAKNIGGGVADTVVTWNTVSGGVGSIIIAGGGAGPVTVANTIVAHNTVTGGFLPGIAIHAFGPGTITGTQLIDNVLSGNGTGEISHQSTGIEIFAVPNVGTIAGTQILHDTVEDAFFGVFHVGDTNTHVVRLATDGVTVEIAP